MPSLAIGHQIADAIAHGGTPWVNLRVETVRTIADAVAGGSKSAANAAGNERERGTLVLDWSTTG